MSTDTVAVIVTILLAVGAAYAALARGLSRLGERLAHVKGIIQGWLNPLPPKVGDQEEERRATAEFCGPSARERVSDWWTVSRQTASQPTAGR